MVHKILLVEDDPCFGSVLKSYLQLSEYEVTLCTNGVEGLEAFRREKFDICLLDVMMPVMDGFTLGRKIHELDASIPFIFITARNQKDDIKAGFAIGADDYIIKPFDSEILILKIAAILNRCEYESNVEAAKIIELGHYTFNTELRTVTPEVGEAMKLTPKESLLLELLYRYRNSLLQREKALTEIWGSSDYFTARSMDVYITKLRKFFKDDPTIEIENIHGAGFRLLIKTEKDEIDVDMETEPEMETSQVVE